MYLLLFLSFFFPILSLLLLFFYLPALIACVCNEVDEDEEEGKKVAISGKFLSVRQIVRQQQQPNWWKESARIYVQSALRLSELF